MLHLSTQTYNSEQVSKIFRQNFSWNVPKNGLFWKYCKSPKLPSVGGSSPRPPCLRRMTRAVQDPILSLNISGYVNAWQFEGKRNFYFIFSAAPSCPKMFPRYWRKI